MIKTSTIKNSIIFSVSGALPMLSSFVLLPFYTKYLSLQTYGNFSIWLTFTFFAQLAIGFGFDSAVHVYFFDFKNDKEKLALYLSSVFRVQVYIAAIGILLSICIFSPWGFAHFMPVFHNLPDLWPYLPLCLFTALGGAVLKTYSNLLVNQQNGLSYFKSNALNFFLVMVFSLLGLYWLGDNLVVPIGARFFAFIVSSVLILHQVSRQYGHRFDEALLKSTLSFNYPVILFSFLNWFLLNADRYIILGLISSSRVGIFDIAVKMATVIELIITGVFLTFNPKIYQLYSESSDSRSLPEINKIYHALTAFVILLVAGYNFAMPLFAPLFIKRDAFLGAVDITVIVSLSYSICLLSNMFINPITFQKRTKYVPIMLLITSSFKFFCSYFLIQRWGLYGAAVALSAYRPVESLVYFLFARKHYHFDFNPVKMIFLPALFMLFAGGSEWVFSDINPHVRHLIVMLVTYASVYVIFRKEIELLVQSLWKRITNSELTS